MLTSEAAIKAIIESVIKKSQSDHDLEQIGPNGSLSRLTDTDHNLISGVSPRSAQGDRDESTTTYCNSSLGDVEKEGSGKKTTSQTGEQNRNVEEGEKGQIASDEEKKKTRIQVSISMLIRFRF